MARKVEVRLIDDIDGSEAHETVRFGLDGMAFEIDLSKKHAGELRGALGPFVARATRNRGVPGQRAPRRGGSDRDRNDAIRAWALRKGMAVAARGRIKAEIVEQYEREQSRRDQPVIPVAGGSPVTANGRALRARKASTAAVPAPRVSRRSRVTTEA